MYYSFPQSGSCTILDFIVSYYGRSHLIRHPSKTPFKAPFKNRFFVTSYPYPRSGALTIRIRVPYKGILCKEVVLKGCLKGGSQKGVLLNDSGHFDSSLNSKTTLVTVQCLFLTHQQSKKPLFISQFNMQSYIVNKQYVKKVKNNWR